MITFLVKPFRKYQNFPWAVFDAVSASLAPVCEDVHTAQGYFELALQSGVLRAEHEDQFLRWFDLMGVQRHLKASGIFARLNQRDGKPGYLQDIPRTLGYIVEQTRIYPELAQLGELLECRRRRGAGRGRGKARAQEEEGIENNRA